MIILEVPHLGDPRTWIAYDLDDYTARSGSATASSDATIWERKTPREMINDYGYPDLNAPADPDADDDDLWQLVRELAEKHGADTPLYRADAITRGDWQPEPISEAEAADAWNASDLSGFWRVSSAEECKEVLAHLEGPNAPRVGKAGPLAAAGVLREAALAEGWIVAEDQE